MSIEAVEVHQIISAIPKDSRAKLHRFLDYEIPETITCQLGQAFIAHHGDVDWSSKEAFWQLLYPNRAYDDKRFTRHMHRTTVQGDRPS